MDRMTFLQAVLLGLAGGSLAANQLQKLAEFTSKVAGGAVSGITRLKRQLSAAKERERMLQEMFWVNSPVIKLVTGDDYIGDEGIAVRTYRSHPHEELAMQAVAAMCPLPAERAQGEAFLADVRVAD